LNGNYHSKEIFKDGGEVNRSTGTDTSTLGGPWNTLRGSWKRSAAAKTTMGKTRRSGKRDRMEGLMELNKIDFWCHGEEERVRSGEKEEQNSGVFFNVKNIIKSISVK
jgi:hypothetical protein